MDRAFRSSDEAGARPPLIVVEGSDDLVRAALADVRASGWKVDIGFSTPPPVSSRGVRHGTVATTADASAALLVVIAGSGIVIDARADPAVLDSLLEDLRHLGPVEHRRALAPIPRVTEEGRQILRLLAAGMTLGEAAADLGLPRRTADRRLSEARRVLGVERTAEAVARARRLGWIA